MNRYTIKELNHSHKRFVETLYSGYHQILTCISFATFLLQLRHYYTLTVK